MTDFLISRIGTRGADGKTAVWHLEAPEPAGPVIADVLNQFPEGPILVLVHTEK